MGGDVQMKTTERGLGWELKKSIHLIILALFPIINCLVYFLMNKKVKQKKWKIMGWVFLLLQVLMISGGILASSLIGTVNNNGSAPKLEDYLGSNYSAKYGSEYKESPEYEQYLKDMEEWEEAPDSVEEQNGASTPSNLKEEVTTYVACIFMLLYAIIVVITLVQRDKYLKLLREKEEEEEKKADEHPPVEGEVENAVESEVEDKAEIETEPRKPEFSMKWFDFVIYIQLFANAVFNLVNGVNLISGIVYTKQGIKAEDVYSMYPQLSTLDKLFGVICLALAVLAIVVRQRLAKYKKDGPIMYLLFIMIQIFALGIYNVGVYMIVQTGNFAVVTGQIVGLVILFAANKVYFDKRKSLFVN